MTIDNNTANAFSDRLCELNHLIPKELEPQNLKTWITSNGHTNLLIIDVRDEDYTVI